MNTTLEQALSVAEDARLSAPESPSGLIGAHIKELRNEIQRLMSQRGEKIQGEINAFNRWVRVHDSAGRGDK